ncbi:plasmodesmata-located protein 8 [Neltuma alba]|uniref:plasmodesmata-located protein 8 n=1 Tax=Neltuma alba TaxID=207710 RepID=UPI0010A46142|nr:plasmodesmata-located protein 8 [Prosopis alba]
MLLKPLQQKNSINDISIILFPNLSSLVLLLLFFFLFSAIIPFSLAYQPHRFIYGGCSQDKYQPNSDFESSLTSFLSSVSSSSSQSTYNSFAIGNSTSSSSDSTIFGLYQCRGDLQLKDCSKCIASCINQIGIICPYATGASLQLEGCYIRYEHFDFLGKPDTNVRFKKCSRSSATDSEFYRRRDDVLAELQAASGFRVSKSGFVEGFAQCLGDLSSEDCSSCLADAVGKLKSLCGSAGAADVFLGQCYVRYWASGYYNEPDSSHNDQVGKSVAIIVGVLAGLAILIVLLSICRKAMD